MIKVLIQHPNNKLHLSSRCPATNNSRYLHSKHHTNNTDLLCSMWMSLKINSKFLIRSNRISYYINSSQIIKKKSA